MSVATRPAPLCCALAFAFAAIAPPAQAAQSFDSCTGYIDSLPATLSTQGTWCLRKNLSTAMTSGSAITVAANNITIDCNGFRFGDLAAGDGTQAVGVSATFRLNTTVRDCGIRGFRVGVALFGGGGHLIESNFIEQSWEAGIFVYGDGNMVRGNRVFDTGGSVAGVPNVTAIMAQAHIIDNTVSDVIAKGDNPWAYGIQAGGAGTEMRDNRVGGLLATGTGLLSMAAYKAGSTNMSVHGNFASQLNGGAESYGVLGLDDTHCRDNRILGFTTPLTCGGPIDEILP